MDEGTRQAVIKAGHGIRAARGKRPDRTLAEHYNTTAMDPVLVGAHDVLDRAIDKLFGASRRITGLEQRQEVLFAHYAAMDATD